MILMFVIETNLAFLLFLLLFNIKQKMVFIIVEQVLKSKVCFSVTYLHVESLYIPVEGY